MAGQAKRKDNMASAKELARVRANAKGVEVSIRECEKTATGKNKDFFAQHRKLVGRIVARLDRELLHVRE